MEQWAVNPTLLRYAGAALTIACLLLLARRAFTRWHARAERKRREAERWHLEAEACRKEREQITQQRLLTVQQDDRFSVENIPYP